MTNRSRSEPVSEMLSLRDAINRLFEQSFVQPTRMFGNETLSMPLNVSENENGFVVEAMLPGVKPEDLNITLQQNVLTISAETKEEQEQGGNNANYYLKERRYGRFSRSFSFPTPVNADQCNASFENGVLRLEVAKAEQAKPRRIAVQANRALQDQTVNVTNESGRSQARGQ